MIVRIKARCDRNRRPVQLEPPSDASSSEASALQRALEADDNFRRDGALGRIFHPGKVSFREISPTNSLHVIIDGSNVSAHVDEVSPLVCRPDGSGHYRWSRVVAHNVAGVAADVLRRVSGRHGDQRCHLECDVIATDDLGGAGEGNRPAAEN